MTVKEGKSYCGGMSLKEGNGWKVEQDNKQRNSSYVLCICYWSSSRVEEMRATYFSALAASTW